MKRIVADLAADFRRWGVDQTKLIRRGINKWGFTLYEYNNGKSG